MREAEQIMNNYSSHNYGYGSNSSGRVSQTNSVAHSHASQSSTSSHSIAAANNTVSSGSETVKCVLIGDAGIGKTSLIVSYTTNGYPSEYLPTVFDTYHVTVSVDNEPIRLELVDTAGSGQRADVTEFRRLAYPQTDVLIICFSVVSPESYASVSQRWLAELADTPCLSEVPRILVGTQSDMREDAKVLLALTQSNRRPISATDANQLATLIGALSYIESSALTQRNMKDIFDLAVVATLRRRRGCLEPVTPIDDATLRQCALRTAVQCASGATSRSGTLDRRKAAATGAGSASNTSSNKLGKLFSKRKDKASESERSANGYDSPHRDRSLELHMHTHSDAAVIESGSMEQIDSMNDDIPRNGKRWKKLFCVGTS